MSPPVGGEESWPDQPVFHNPNTVDLPVSVLDGTPYGQRPYGAPPADDWGFHLLPESLIYRSYLAGVKESRMSGHLVSIDGDGTIWDSTLGARVGLFRFGSGDGPMPQGFQVDVEGSAQVRLDVDNEVDVRAVDFRAGVPLTYGWGNQQTKLAYYHLSSHLGDEFLLKNPGYPRLNYARDVVVLGHSIYLPNDVRIYGEVGYAFYNIVAEHWEFQFGAEYAPMCPTGIHGAPFLATNVHLREELDYGGTFVAQAGWAWRGDAGNRLLRIGAHFQVGKSNELSFFNESERQIGFGVWYDF